MAYYESNFGNTKEWCHQHSGKPARKVKLCPCGKDKGCPICGFGEMTRPHVCKFIKVR